MADSLTHGEGHHQNWYLSRILATLEQQLSQGEKIMAAVSDVTAAITKLGTDVSAEISAVAAAIAAASASGGATPAQLDTFVSQLNALDATVTAETTAITPTPTPAPTPTPTA